MSGDPFVKRLILLLILAIFISLPVSVLAEQIDYGDTPATAHPMTPGIPVLDADLYYELDIDYFSFPAVNGAQYTITGTILTLPNLEIVLYDTDGTTQLDLNTINSDVGNIATINWTCPSGGTYYIKASNGNIGYAFGTYTIDITELLPDDHGNDSSTATPVTVGGTATNGELESQGDLDYFSFTAEANKIYLVTMTFGTLTDAFLGIYDPAFVTSSYLSSTGEVTLAVSIDTAGTYYAAVEQYGGLGTYSISISVYTPSFTATASDTTITFNWGGPNPVITHINYRIYIGTQSGIYDPAYTADVTPETHIQTGLMNYTTYYAKVVYVDETGGEHAYTDEIFATPYPTFTNSSKSYVGGPANYVMISFPLILGDTNPVNNLGPILNPVTEFSTHDPLIYDPSVWRIYCNDINQYYQPEYAGTNLVPGCGYWMISLNDAIINLTGASVDSSNDFTVTLASGWNMIGNPFNFNVSVSDLKVTDMSVTQSISSGAMTLPDLYTYKDGAYVISTQIQPNEGYWIKNTTAGDITLSIPPIVAAPSPAVMMYRRVSSGERPPLPPSMSASGGDGGMCFIATAAYEDESAPTVLETIFDMLIGLFK